MSHPSNRIINHKVLRQGTGIIAILLPILTYTLSGKGSELHSISASYWTYSGDIFVGSLVAVAFFLAAYNGTGSCNRDAEYFLSKFAGGFALIVALFPTNNGRGAQETPKWVTAISDALHIQTTLIHFTAAALLFVCLFWLMTFFSRRAFYKGKIMRSNFYKLIGWSMVIGMLLAYFIVEGMDREDAVFWVELVGLWLFGLGWLVAGSYNTDPENQALSEARFIGEWQVDARSKNFPSGLTIQPGKRYLFEASGCWQDWFLSCGPTGWGPSWRWFTRRNRLKHQPYFMLCANVDKKLDEPSLVFPIGKEQEWTAPAEISNLPEEERKLYFFANDRETKYGNNKGFLTVKAYALD